jgi:hypothetical protein
MKTMGHGMIRAALAAACALMVTTAASRARAADEEESAAPETKAAAHAKPDMGKQGTVYAGTAVSSSPYVLLGYFPAKDFTIAAGLGLTVNGNGSAASPLTGLKGDANAQVGSDLVLAMAYFVVDKFPFAMGPEIVMTGSMAPGSPFDTVVVAPMWALRVAPWAAPVAIGTDLGMSVAMAHGAKPMASLTTNGLDILFAF